MRRARSECRYPTTLPTLAEGTVRRSRDGETVIDPEVLEHWDVAA
jgi:hypothetical protein